MLVTLVRTHYNRDISKGGEELMGYYTSIGFTRETFDSYKCNRLKALKKRIADGTMDENLRVVEK